MFEALRRTSELVKSAIRHEKQHPGMQRKREELEFLPASLEILESPPSEFAHVLMLMICALLVLVLCWGWFSQVETEATAAGKIFPAGQVKKIQSLIIGRVASILVKEGDYVSKGQLLVRLDTTEPEVDIRQVRSSLLVNELNRGRLQVLLESSDNAFPPFPDLQLWFTSAGYLTNPELVTPDHWDRQQKLLDYDLLRHHSTDHALIQEIQQKKAAIAATQAEIERLSVLSPLYEDHERSVHKLYKQGFVSRIEWLNAREKQVETSQQLVVRKSQLVEARSALSVRKSERDRYLREYRQERMEKLDQYHEKVNELKLTIIKAMERDQNGYIRAPESGTIQRLQIHSEDSVVEPAQTLMLLVPDQQELQVEAMVENKDIGFIHTGMPADIKIETFPYTFYGYLTGVVEKVSKDAVEQNGRGLLYPVIIKLHQNSVTINQQRQPLQVDMMVTAEIRTGKRRLLEFFMDPFLRYRDEAFNVR